MTPNLLCGQGMVNKRGGGVRKGAGRGGGSKGGYGQERGGTLARRADMKNDIFSFKDIGLVQLTNHSK